jgi:hypothetical protein
MLVIYDDAGSIEQTVIIGDFGSLQPLYEAQGKRVLSVDDIVSPERLYVKDGAVVDKPNIAVTGEVRAIKADGNDTLTFIIAPQAFNLTVRLDGAIVHQESSEAGALDFSVTHPGTYTLFLDAAFPYYPATITVEAT